jgi:hypothetical protein
MQNTQKDSLPKEEEKRKRQPKNKCKANSNMIVLSSSIAITLNLNLLHTPIKRHRLSDLVSKKNKTQLNACKNLM